VSDISPVVKLADDDLAVTYRQFDRRDDPKIPDPGCRRKVAGVGGRTCLLPHCANSSHAPTIPLSRSRRFKWLEMCRLIILLWIPPNTSIQYSVFQIQNSERLIGENLTIDRKPNFHDIFATKMGLAVYYYELLKNNKTICRRV